MSKKIYGRILQGEKGTQLEGFHTDINISGSVDGVFTLEDEFETLEEATNDLLSNGFEYDTTLDLWVLDTGEPTLGNLTDMINEWLFKQDYFKSSFDVQVIKLMEEAGELAKGRIKGDEDVIVDSIGDIFVVLLTLCHFKGITITDAVARAYKDIKGRKYEVTEDRTYKRIK